LETIAFIDHSFHIKSRATSFLIDILKKKFIVDIFWDESWTGKNKFNISNLNRKKYHAIIFFQILNYSVEELIQTKCNNIIIIPMYDSVIELPDIFWMGYDKVKFINFSKTLHERMNRLGFVTRYFQYFPPPDKTDNLTENFSELKGFFWQRTDDITWNHIRQLISDSCFTGFHLHDAIDPLGYTFCRPEKEEMVQYKINIST
jgi:hypothetical protein